MSDTSTDTVTEAQLTPNLKALTKKSAEAIRVKNFDYAIKLLLSVLESEPKFFAGRKLLRKAEILKAGGKKSSLKIPLLGLKKKLKADPWAVINELEEKTFPGDPYNIQANELLFEAGVAIGDLELAIFGLHTLHDGHPSNTKLLHKVAEHYIDHAMPEKAGEVYADILKVDPRDPFASKGLTNANAQATMNTQKWSGDARDVIKDQDETLELVQESRTGMSKGQLEEALAKWSERYEEDPNDQKTVLKVASLCEELGDLPGAIQYYEWAHTLNSVDSSLLDRVEKLKAKSSQKQVDVLTREIRDNPDAADIDEKKVQLEELTAAHRAQVVASCQELVDRNPTDMQARFALGEQLFLADEFSEAIPQLQKSKSNAGLRVKSMLMLGKCYSGKNMHDLAVKQVEEALVGLLGMDETKKELHYNAGLIYEAMGNKEKMLEHLKVIYESDYDYLDVAQRVEASYG